MSPTANIVKISCPTVKQSTFFSHVTPGCFTLQANSELEVLRRQSQVLLETAATNEQLNEALGQIEELQHELGREKEKRASKEEELHAELQQLQESTLLAENQGEFVGLQQFVGLRRVVGLRQVVGL